jgi:hypothetical protein
VAMETDRPDHIFFFFLRFLIYIHIYKGTISLFFVVFVFYTYLQGKGNSSGNAIQ